MKATAAPNMRSTPDISVIGPLARSADDLRTSIDVLAGPDPDPRHWLDLDLSGRSLKDLHIGIWRGEEQAPVAKEVISEQRTANALRDAGAQLNEEALDPTRPSPTAYTGTCRPPWLRECPMPTTTPWRNMSALLIQPIKAMLPKPSVAKSLRSRLGLSQRRTQQAALGLARLLR